MRHQTCRSTIVLLVLCAAAPALLHAQMCLSPDGQATPPANRGIHTNLYRGEQEFAMNMLAAITKATPNENIFFSPYSTYHALLLAYFGASGATLDELTKVLHLNWSKSKAEIVSAYHLEKKRRARDAKLMPLKFASADRIYFDEQIQLSTCLESVLHDELISVSFRQDAEKCRQDINAWIANTTNNEIPEMLSAGDIDGSTNMVLANAAYFKGQWVSQFSPDDTKQEPFYTSPNNPIFVPMMHKKGTYQLTIDERIGAHVLQMPYLTSTNEDADSDISMVIVLPPSIAKIEDVLAKLKPDTIKQALDEGMPREIDISLPKFEFEQRLELVPILRQMGINSIFEASANFHDLSADENISFGDAKHVAKIKVDEEGSTAAAATVLVSFRSARPIEPTKFDCNHPFLFLIYDRRAEAVLFTGIYRDPTTKK